MKTPILAAQILNMSIKNYLNIISLGLFISSCSPEPEIENKEFEREVIGEWESVSIKLTMNSFNNKDTVVIYEVSENNWEASMNLKPIRTVYNNDGTYTSQHRNLQDSLIYAPAGIWMILGDSLLTRDTFPEKALPYKYKIFLKNNELELTGTEDCDRDGNADDLYQGILRKKK